MGLKPLNHLNYINPFTKVNGKLFINPILIRHLLPSALADGFYKSLLSKALAIFQFDLNQLFYLQLMIYIYIQVKNCR